MLPATYQPPPVPPWLRNDGVKCADFLTTSQFAQFRLALPPGRFRRYADLAYWTGQHTRDVCSMQRWMLDPGYQWEGSEIRGRWFRRNQKSKVEPCWCVMEPELRVLALEWLAEPGPSERQLVGPLNNLRRTFFEAAARAGTPVVRPNLGLRASHATLLMAREWSYEYVRIVLGHKGEVGLTAIGGSVEERYRVSTAKRPSTLVRHYARQSPEILRPRG